jgi:hypothetical protein
MNKTPPVAEFSCLGRLPWGLFGMLALVVLAERFVDGRKMDFLDTDDWNYRASQRASSSREVLRSEVLCFGDSLVKFGVIPRAVGDRTGRRVYNLAVPASQAPSSYVLLRRALDAGARPEAVIVDYYSPILRQSPQVIRTRWPYLLSTTEAVELAWSARDAEFLGSLIAARILPSLRGRASVRANIMAAVGGRFDWRRWANTLTQRNRTRNGGALLLPNSSRVAKLSAAEVETTRREIYGEFQCHPVNAEAIRRFLSLAAAHGIQVYWVLPPACPTIRDGCVGNRADAEHRAFLLGWQARFPNLTVVDARNSFRDPDVFYDAHHLTGPAAYGFSLALGNALRHTLSTRGEGSEPGHDSSARWVHLPACQARPIPDGVEDLDASRLALERWKTSTRQ